MTDELDPEGVEAAARGVEEKFARAWLRLPSEPPGDDSFAYARAAITAYLQATPPRGTQVPDGGIEGITNNEVDAFLAERAAPLREDGATEREIERLQRVVRQQQQRLDDQGHGIQMTQHALTARNARIAELEALLEERDGDGVERPHSSGEPDGAGENPDGPLLVATTTQDSRDE